MIKGAKGTVRSIHTCSDAGQPMGELSSVRALKGEGLEGDRYLHRRGTYSKTHAPDREVTLIEAETLDWLAREHGIALAPQETRRNLVTEGIVLNDLIGRRFRVGDEVVLEGVRQCVPCGYLERLTGKPVFAPLQDKGGLRTFIVQGGTIRVGDAITELAEAEAAPPLRTPPSRG